MEQVLEAKVTEKYDAWMPEQLKFCFGTSSRFIITYCFVAK